MFLSYLHYFTYGYSLHMVVSFKTWYLKLIHFTGHEEISVLETNVTERIHPREKRGRPQNGLLAGHVMPLTTS